MPTSCCRHSRKFLLKNIITYLTVASRQTQHLPHPVCIVLKFSYICDCNRFSGSCLMIASDEA